MSQKISPILVHKDKSNARIVSLLEELLEQAKQGKIQGIFFFQEDGAENVEHSRDGMSDNRVVFLMELIKRRILKEYE